MGFLGRLRRAVDIASDLGREIENTATVVDDLARAVPLGGLAGGGGGNGGGPGPQYQASSIAPIPGSGGVQPGGSLRIGGSSGGGGSEGSDAAGEGIESPETNRDKIGAIIEEAGVAAPPPEAWDENGTGPGEFPGLIFRTVLELGTSAPQRFLVWCAGWLAYSAAATTAGLGSKGIPNRSRHGGPTSEERAEQRRRDLGFAVWSLGAAQTAFQSEGAPGFSTGGNNPDRGGANSWNGGGSDNSGGSWTASTSKAVANGVAKAQEPVVRGIDKMVEQMGKLTESLRGDGGVGVRAGRG